MQFLSHDSDSFEKWKISGPKYDACVENFDFKSRKIPLSTDNSIIICFLLHELFNVSQRRLFQMNAGITFYIGKGGYIQGVEG